MFGESYVIGVELGDGTPLYRIIHTVSLCHRYKGLQSGNGFKEEERTGREISNRIEKGVVSPRLSLKWSVTLQQI